MVEDRITDPTRIAQLLASELTGLQTGPLEAVEVVDADRSAEPSSDGTVAYSVAYVGQRVARVELYPESVVVALLGELSNAPISTDSDDSRLTIERASGVKRAIDALRERLADSA